MTQKEYALLQRQILALEYALDYVPSSADPNYSHCVLLDMLSEMKESQAVATARDQ